MGNSVKTVIYPVKDLAGAKAGFAALLDAEPYMDTPYYVGFNVDGQDIGLDPNGHSKGLTGPTPYVHVDDIHAKVEQLTAAGAEVRQKVRDVGEGKLIAVLTDAQGNAVGLVQEAPGS